MHLRILLPTEVFADRDDVLEIIADSNGGSFGLLPRRLDCVAALSPGILTYKTEKDGTVYLAIDAGVLVKTGSEVLCSVRRAIGGVDLSQLHDAVKQQFLVMDEQEKAVRAAVSKMESSFVSRFREFQHGR